MPDDMDAVIELLDRCIGSLRVLHAHARADRAALEEIAMGYLESRGLSAKDYAREYLAIREPDWEARRRGGA
jgi:hypothetical protein